jgi:hypothetical protein
VDDMQTIKCCVCGELFGIDEATSVVLHRTQQIFYCPFGHTQHFTEREVEDPPEAEIIPFKIIDGDKE